jgi:mannitol/fructose-specific phosphotransferase system IIA component (Ntr-type)
MKVSDLLIREAIITDLKALTKEDAFREIVHSVQDAGQLAHVDPEELVGALQRREELSPQVVGRGVFCPEGGHPGVDRVVGTIALSHQGIDFVGIDGRPVDVIMLLLGPKIIAGRRIQPGEPALWYGWQALTPIFNDGNVVDRLRKCRTREEVFDVATAAVQETPGASETGS